MIAFLFPGQGAQHVGMGADLVERHAAARRVFEEASEAIHVDLLALCRDGPEDRLRETENTQPAILTCSWAAAAVLAGAGVGPDLAAGLSLGEYTALVAAGAMDFADAVRVVRQRGRFMHEAAAGQPTAMAAVLGLDAARVVEVCAGVAGFVEATNFNAPGQVVIGGEGSAVEEASRRLRGAGARRVVPLAVSAPFHTSRMRPAADRLAAVLAGVPIRTARIPVVANVSAEPVREPAEIRAAVIAQVASPVRWEESLRTLHRLGAHAFLEVGPGTTLAGLAKKTLPEVPVASVGGQAALEDALALPVTAASARRDPGGQA